MSARELLVRFKGETDPSVGKAANDTQKALGGVGDASEETSSRHSRAMGVIAGVASSVASGVIDMAGRAGSAIVGFAKSSVTGASDLNETLSKSEAIFGDQAAGMEQWASTASTTMGLSQAAALDAASSFGDMFSQLGFAGDEAAGMSQSVVQLAADLGSFNNLDTSEVLDMLSASFRGEYDSLQRIIPNISAARVQEQALAETGKTSADALTAQEKAHATLSIVQQDGARAAGDFARTSGGAANQQKIFAAQVDDLKTKFGQGLLPVLNTVLGFLTGTLMPGLQSLGDKIAPTFDAIGQKAGPAKQALKDGWTFGGSAELQPDANPVVNILRKVGSTAADAKQGFTEFKNGVTGTFTDISAQASPFQQVMFGLGSGIRENVIPAADGIRDAFGGLLGKLQPIIEQVQTWLSGKLQQWGPKFGEYANQVTAIIGGAMDLISSIIHVVGDGISAFWSQWGSTILGIASAAWNMIGNVIGGALDIIQGVIKVATSIFRGDWNGAWEGIKQITGGARDIIVGIIGGLKDAAVAIWNGIVGFISDKTQGLRDGVVSGFNSLKDGVSSAMDAVRGAAARPINFVINTVYNDGIRRLVNAVVGVFGGDGLPEVSPIALARGAMMGDGRRPILWNEAGPEAYIPLDGSARSRSLWVQTGQALGALPMKDGGILDAAGDLVHLITDLPKTIGDLKDKLVEIGSTGWGRIIKGSITSLIDRAKTWVTDKLGSFGSSGGAGVDQWTSTAVAAMAAAGLPGTYLPLLMHRMQVESGGNPNAINLWDSNAQAGMPSQGLMQVIPPTFAAYAGPYAGLGITNPFANIYAAIKYSLARYGLQGIPAAWGGTGGYDSGGWLPPGATLAVNQTGRPEAVFTHNQLTEILDKLDALIAAINLLIGRPALDQQTLSGLLAGVAARRGEALV